MLLTVLLSKLFGLLIGHVSLGLQVGLVSDQDDDLETQQKKASLFFHCSSWNSLSSDSSGNLLMLGSGVYLGCSGKRLGEWVMCVKVLTKVDVQRCVWVNPLTVLGLVRFLASVNQLLR